EDDPDKETEGYDVRLDLEIGGLVAGSVSAECRGYVVSRQSTGKYRGSVLWRDLVLVMRRGDGVDKATIFEDVIAERQEPNEGVRPYAERLRTNFIKLGAINSPLSADDQVMYLLRGLQPRMDTHRVAVRAFRQSGTAYTFDAALSFLLQQEAAASLDRSQAPKRLSLLSRPTANWAAGENQGQIRKFHVIRNSANKGQPGYFNGECRHCHKWGHKQEDCAQRKREIDAGLVDPKHPSAKVAQSGEVEEQEESGSDVEGDIYEVMDANGEVFFARLATGPVGDTDNEANAAVAMMAHSSIAIASKAAVSHPDWTNEDLDSFSEAHIPKNAIKWILDSGATHHMTPRSELLPVRVKAATGAVVHIADGTKANIERRGACIASMFGDGGTEAKNVVLKTVLVVPSFTTNLLSVQRLAEDGWTVKFARTGAELVSPKGERVETFTEPGTGAPFVMLRTQPVKYIDVKGSARRMGPAMAAANVAITDRDLDEAAKWHQRMGHLSYHALRILASNPAFARPSRPSLQAFARIIAEEDLCEPCVETKQPLLPFGNSETVPEAKMSDVAFDLVGPFEGNKEFKYAFNLSEAWARMLWSFPIPNKEAATVFAVFKQWVDLMKEHGHGSIRRIHCDHGGEFENRLFESWAAENGVEWCFSAPNTSQQNGLIERWNRTLQERARTMLRSARLSDSFWPYAFRAAADLINRSPSTSIGNQVPLVLWSDKPVDYESIRVFGCLCWVIKPVKSRTNKLSVRSVRGTYLGLAPQHDAYLVYTPSERPHLRITRHVVFNERLTYDARFALDQKQQHIGSADDIIDLVLPKRAVKLSDVPVEPDQAPIGEWYNADKEDKQLDHEDWTVTLDNGNRDDQVQGQFGEWPALESLLGEDDDDEDLVTNEFTGELSRVNTQQHLPPSVQGTRDAYSQVDDFDEPIGLDDLDRMFEDTPTQVTFEPTVGAVLPAAPQPRRSKRIESQFKALTATIELSLLAASGDEVHQRATEIAARAFSAAIRSTADGVLIEPKSLADAKKRDDWAKWEEGMKSEINSLESMRTWDLVNLPEGRKPIGCRWTYKLKTDTEGMAARWKARLVAQGFSQKAGIDYDETFAPVARLTTIRILFALALRHKMKIWSMDVVTAYLNGTITEDIFMMQPPNFDDGSGRVCKLRRSLYGLKQSGREWFSVVATWLKAQGFWPTQSEPCVFTKRDRYGNAIIIVLYVDDVLIACQNQSTIDSIRDSFSQRFRMTDNGPLSQVLGLKVDINHGAGTATISQQAYIDSIIRRFGMDEANAVDSPMTAALQGLGRRTDGQATAAEICTFASLIGCEMWAAQGTRPDIAYAVSRLARFMANPRPEHIVGAYRLLRYLKGTSGIGLVFTDESNVQIEGFCDADHAKDHDNRRSVSGYAFFVHGNLVSWRSRLQATVAISSTESEYVAMSEAAREAKWLRTFTTELDFAPRRPTDIFTDSSGAYSLARNPEGHNRLKHIDVHHHFVRELVANQQVSVTQIGTDENAADTFTKVTSLARLQDGMSQLGLGDNRLGRA
ncbi:hypothetical protein A4X06_0g8158, partial [Tilletia controversa]